MKYRYSRISLLFILLITFNSLAQTQGTRPNIIVILADDLGYADVGFNRDSNFPSDQGIIPTPNIDALANSGIILKNAHVVHPFCGPSRVALLTGIYPHRIGGQYNLPNDITSTIGVPQSETYFSKVLQDANYNTSAIGKWHLGFENGKYQPLDRGFDHFFGFLGGGKNYFESIYEDSFYNRQGGSNPITNEYQDPLQRNRDYVTRNEYSNAIDEDYLTDVLTDNAIQYLSENTAKTDPFFMYLAYNAPHTPLQIPAAEVAQFKADNPNFESLVRGSTYLTESDPVNKLSTQAEKDAKVEEFVEARILYAAMTVNMDNNIGRVVAELKKDMNVFNNTVIIFLSDNGGYRWSKGAVNFPLQQQKGSVLEGGHKVPMFVSWPNKISVPSTYDFQVSSLDIYPTVAKLAGATIPASKKLDGLDFMDKIIAGQKVRADDKPLFAVRPQNGFQNGGLVSYPWKIVKTGNNGTWRLYNILTDPGETTDVRSSETNAEQIVKNLLDEAVVVFSEFKDVKPAWYDNDGDGSGHIHSFLWNDGTLPGYDRLFERSLENVNNDGLPLSDQQNDGNWVLNTEISDEFDATTLNENQWLIQGRNGEYQSNFIGRAPSQFSTDNAIVEDGKLKILTKWEPSYNFNPTQNGDGEAYENITTAAVISKKQFQYGYMEIKSKAADAEVTSSFWTTGPGPGLSGNSELDMFEMFGGHKTNDAWKKRLKFNIISWDPNNSIKQAATAAGEAVGTTHTRNIQADNNTADGFHVYGFEWTADYIKVYIDGVLHPDGTILKSVITNNGAEPDRWVTDVPYWVWFDSETFPWLGLPEASDLQTPAEYQIEYIRVWQKQPDEITVSGNTNAIEGSTDGIFAVALSNGEIATQDIDVTYTVGGTANEGTDYNTIARTVTIANGTNAAEITINALEDNIDEAPETVSITLTSSSTKTVNTTEASITISDVIESTTLTAGDIAIVGWKSGSGKLAFMLLKDITATTKLSISNRTWSNTTNEFTGDYTVDDIWTWTSDASFSSGDILMLDSDGQVKQVVGNIEEVVGTTSHDYTGKVAQTSDIDFDFSVNGEGILIFQADPFALPTDANSTSWIAGLNTAFGWGIGGGNSRSDLPTALTNGVNANIVGEKHDFGVYTGALSGSAAQLRASINNSSNWSFSEATTFNLWSFDKTSSNTSGDIGTAGTLSTADLLSLQLSVFPNPVKDYFQLNFREKLNNLEVEIFSVSGKSVKKVKVINVNNQKVDVTSLSTGIYILKIKTDNHFLIKKVIKL